MTFLRLSREPLGVAAAEFTLLPGLLSLSLSLLSCLLWRWKGSKEGQKVGEKRPKGKALGLEQPCWPGEKWGERVEERKPFHNWQEGIKVKRVQGSRNFCQGGVIT